MTSVKEQHKKELDILSENYESYIKNLESECNEKLKSSDSINQKINIDLIKLEKINEKLNNDISDKNLELESLQKKLNDCEITLKKSTKNMHTYEEISNSRVIKEENAKFIQEIQQIKQKN